MTLLLAEIFLWLLAAVVIGAVAAWFFRRNIALRREDIIQQHWRDRVRQLELDRDRTVQKLSADISTLNKAASQGAKSAGLADYENLASALEGQVAEREAAIAELGSEIRSLRGELAEAGVSATQRETALLQEHKKETADLLAQLEQPDDQASSEREAALRQQHEQDMSRLTTQFEQRQSQALSECEDALRQKHEQEISRLKSELERQSNQSGSGHDARIEQLAAEIRLRDDSIAMLRHDLAELSDNRSIDLTDKKDEQLRAAIDESVAWQEKYEAAAAKLSRTEREKFEIGQPQAADYRPEPAPALLARKRERSTGDRIGFVLSHPGGPKDRLREIKGIGPVLERKLNDVGIYHFRQIAEFDAEDIARLSNELGRLSSRITRDEWVRQAKTLHRKYHD